MPKNLDAQQSVKVFVPGNSLSTRIKNHGPFNKRVKSIFLAGTIDNGASEDWQDKFIKVLQEPVSVSKDVIAYRVLNIFNPRRKDWDNSWKQTLENAQFNQQVNWEYDALCKADIIVMNILPDSKSPITLLELGMFADTGKILMVCPKEFYRKGNIDFVCEKYDIPQFESIEEVIKYLDNRVI